MHRIWSHAAVAAAALVLIPTLAVTIAWFVDPGSRDVDLTSVFELIMFFVMLFTVPALALAFGVFAPSAIVADRLARGRISRALNALVGVALAVPALLAFFLVGAFIAGGANLQAYLENLRRPLSTAANHPERGLVVFAIFATAGIIVGLGMRHRVSQ